MKTTEDVVEALAALAHEHRLVIFRLLVERGPDGLPAGEIADWIGLPPSSLTFHLQHLNRAGLLTKRRSGRQLIYATDFDVMNQLVGYLTENCCGGAADCSPVCAPDESEPLRSMNDGGAARSLEDLDASMRSYSRHRGSSIGEVGDVPDHR